MQSSIWHLNQALNMWFPKTDKQTCPLPPCPPHFARVIFVPTETQYLALNVQHVPSTSQQLSKDLSSIYLFFWYEIGYASRVHFTAPRNASRQDVGLPQPT